MPQTPFDPNVGFQGYFIAPDEPEVPEEVSGGTLGAAFRQNNPTFNFLDYMTAPTFKPDPTFNLTEALKRDGHWDNDRYTFLGVQSADEYANVAWKMQQERKDKQALAAAGWGGVAALIAAGVVDPTMFLPLTAGGRGLRAVGEGAALGFGAAAVSETALQASQVDRSTGETAFSLGTGTVVGGVLGGAVSMLTRSVDEVASAVDRETLLGSVSPSTVATSLPSPGGAAVTRVDPGGLKTFAPGAIQDVAAQISPVVRTINQETSQQARWMMQQLDTGGLRMEGNKAGVPTSPGGAVADRVLQWQSPVVDVLQTLDRQYAEHWFGNSDPRFMGNLRAAVGGTLVKGVGKLTKQEFREAVAQALTEGDVHPIPQVAAVAKDIRARVIEPMFEEGKKAGLFKDAPPSPLGDESYLMRAWDRDKVRAKFPQLVSILARHFDKKMQAAFEKKLIKFQAKTEKDTQRVADMKLPEADADAQRAEIAKKLKETEEGRSADLMSEEDQIAELRQQAKKASGQERAGLLEGARAIEQRAGAPLAELRKTRAGLRSRLKNLSRNRYIFERKLQEKLERIDDIEEAGARSLERLVRSGRKFLDKLDTMTDEQLDGAVDQLERQFDTVSAKLDKTEAKLYKELEGDNDPLVEQLFYRASDANKKLDELFSRIEIAKGADREVLRQAVQDGLDAAVEKVNGINLRRGERIGRLKENASRVDPKLIDEEVKRIEARIPKAASKLIEETRKLGADDVDLEGGSAEFSQFAKDRATEVARKLQGAAVRIPGIDILQGERGPELARLLDIPSNEVKDFLERDVEKVIKSYVRTLGPDIELSRKFGSPNAVEEFRKLYDERDAQKEVIEASNLSKEAKERKTAKLDKQYQDLERDLTASIGRLRHTFGLPVDPDAISQRLARVALNWQVLRLMGMVTVSSVSDPMRAVSKYGPLHTFRDAFVPMITSFKTFKLSASEARMAGTALDVVLHSRSSAILDVMDTYGRGNKFERTLEYATGKMGLLAGFDYWTAAAKQFTGVVVNAQLVKAIQDVVEKGGRPKSVEFLASVGIDGPLAERMWKEITSTKGGGKVKGVWLPNTESWTDQEAVRAYRAALAGEIDDAIITPGLERPLWVNKTTPGRLIAQFKSFGFASTTKSVMAGLQARDLAYLNGTIGSVALGALSYYIYANLAGGQVYEKMQNATLGEWVDEAIDRSGTLGILSDVQRFADNVPFIMNTNIPGTDVPTHVFAGRFGGRPVSRSEGQGWEGQLLGPSVGAGDAVYRILMGLDQPTQSTAHQLRVLMPLQNTFWLRQGLDKIGEANPAGLPERRGQ